MANNVDLKATDGRRCGYLISVSTALGLYNRTWLRLLLIPGGVLVVYWKL